MTRRIHTKLGPRPRPVPDDVAKIADSYGHDLSATELAEIEAAAGRHPKIADQFTLNAVDAGIAALDGTLPDEASALRYRRGEVYAALTAGKG